MTSAGLDGQTWHTRPSFHVKPLPPQTERGTARRSRPPPHPGAGTAGRPRRPVTVVAAVRGRPGPPHRRRPFGAAGRAGRLGTRGHRGIAGPPLLGRAAPRGGSHRRAPVRGAGSVGSSGDNASRSARSRRPADKSHSRQLPGGRTGALGTTTPAPVAGRSAVGPQRRRDRGGDRRAGDEPDGRPCRRRSGPRVLPSGQGTTSRPPAAARPRPPSRAGPCPPGGSEPPDLRSREEPVPAMVHRHAGSRP
jgi:hypothetical protein